jgi:RNA polymerase sigma-70 factor, ECF subfamily
MSDPDQRLMRRFQKGDVSAFEVLLHKFEAPVLSLVRRYLGSRSSGVEDVAQEVFIRIYRSKHTYEPKAKVGTWIYRITVNTCLNEIRRLGADKNRRVGGFTAMFGRAGDDGEPDGSSGFADAKVSAPSEELATSELEGKVREAIDRLPEQQRLAVVLSRYHGLAYEDVAEAMESSVPAVKSLLTRARENLRKALEGYVGGAEGEGNRETTAGRSGGSGTARGESDDV